MIAHKAISPYRGHLYICSKSNISLKLGMRISMLYFLLRYVYQQSLEETRKPIAVKYILRIIAPELEILGDKEVLK